MLPLIFSLNRSATSVPVVICPQSVTVAIIIIGQIDLESLPVHSSSTLLPTKIGSTGHSVVGFGAIATRITPGTPSCY